MKYLKGITWNHTRGLLPKVAAAQRFEEENPGVTISWEKRSLQAFADAPIEELAKEYDFLIIDHPHAGVAAESRALLPLDEYLDTHFIEELTKEQVGKSFESYYYGGHQWALPVDTASPVASWVVGQLQEEEIPHSWNQLLALAGKGKLVVPLIPIDTLMLFYTFCLDTDKSLFEFTESLVDWNTGLQAISYIRELANLVDGSCFDKNPIHIYETLLDDSNEAVYCPFAYGYLNYSKRGYSKQKLQFGDVVSSPTGKRLHTTLGGAGIAISSFTKYPDLASKYASYMMSASCQSTLYFDSGGQPGHRAAWLSEYCNEQSIQFFKNTISTLDQSYVRPRYNGYMYFQDNACLPLQLAIKGEISNAQALEEMNEIYKQSLRGKPIIERVQ